jgi:endoglucanase
VWTKLAREFHGHPALYGYELMNEPHDMPEGSDSWAYLAQAATDAIRREDQSAWILVPGYGWQTARHWPENNRNLNVRDSANRLLYAAHQYFDRDSSGTYVGSYNGDGVYANIGVDRIRPFLDWLAARNARGIFTEYGIPDNDSRWLTVLDRFLDELDANPRIDGGTYWSSGPWWGSYPLSIEPRNGSDRPQMTILEKYRTR